MTDGFIRPGHVFIDDRGSVAQLHGAGVRHHDGRWYAWGEDKSAGDTFTAVACYSSTDLSRWRFEADALVPVEGGDIGSDRIVERPKVLRRPDGAWVMLLHIDTADYSAARVGYALADSPIGPFRYIGSERPLGHLSRDIGVYQEDGVGYLLSEDRENGLHLYRLRDDFLAVESVLVTLKQQDRPEVGYESPALVRHDGLYYLFGSDLTGWAANDNRFTTAEHLAGPWSPWRGFAPDGAATFDSQVSAVVPVEGGYIYVGDRWQPDDLYSSPAVWLPLVLGGGDATLEWREAWRMEDL